MGGVDGWEGGVGDVAWDGTPTPPRGVRWCPPWIRVLVSVNCTLRPVVLEERTVRRSRPAPRWLTMECVYVCAVCVWRTRTGRIAGAMDGWMGGCNVMRSPYLRCSDK